MSRRNTLSTACHESFSRLSGATNSYRKRKPPKRLGGVHELLLVRAAVSEGNAARLVTAVRQFFGSDLPGLEKSCFLDAESETHVGARPNYIEILPKVSGLEFRDAYLRSVTVELDGIPIRLISLGDLLTHKRASGRTKDLADLEKLSMTFPT